MDAYQAGTATDPVFLAADINTVGLAHTRAVVRAPQAGSPVIASVASRDASGDISPTILAAAAQCAGNTLVVATQISLITLPEEEREAECTRLSATYSLEGGTGGPVTYDAPDEKVVSTDGSTVVLRKLVQLTA